MSYHLHIDPFSGIAGDMFLGAMIELGVDLAELNAAFSKLPIEQSYRLTAERVQRQGIGATDFKVIIDHSQQNHDNREHNHGHNHHHHHHHVHYKDMLAMIDLLETTDRGRQRARDIVDKLAYAEAKVHGVAVEKVHFHEVGALDSIIDMLGAAIAMEMVGVDTVSCGPLPISRGFVNCEHGQMPVPAPATAEIMCGLKTVGVDREMELVTPTGAAIVAGLVNGFEQPPEMILKAVGSGAGDRDTPTVPNILRLMLGETR